MPGYTSQRRGTARTLPNVLLPPGVNPTAVNKYIKDQKIVTIVLATDTIQAVFSLQLKVFKMKGLVISYN
jgi:hypothetical protein